MVSLTFKFWHASLWSHVAWALGRPSRAETIEIDRLSDYMLRDLGVSRDNPVDPLTAERVHFIR